MEFGNQPIKPEEFEKSKPIRFNFGANADVLDANVLETVPNDNKEIVKEALQLNAGKITLEPLLLNIRDSIKLKMLVTRVSGPINLEAHIVGVKTLRHSSVSESRLFSRNTRREVSIGLLSLLVGVVVGGSGSVVWLRYFQKSQPNPPIAKNSHTPTQTSSPRPTQPIFPYEITQIYRHHTGGVFSVAWSPSGKYIASTGLDKTVQAWVPNGKSDITLFMQNLFGIGESVTWSPDDRYIATGDDANFVHIWDWQANKSIFDALQTNQLRSIAWSPNGKYLAFSTVIDGFVHVLDVSKVTSVRSLITYTGHSKTVEAISWSPDSLYIASASADHTVQIWDASNKNWRFTYKGHSAHVWSVSWSHDGKYIASGDEQGEVHIWSLPLVGQKPAEDLKSLTFQGAQGHVCAHALSWSFDNKYLVAGSWNKTIVVIRRQDNYIYQPFENHKGSIGAVAWSPNSSLIASASSDNTDTTVQIWQAIPL